MKRAIEPRGVQLAALDEDFAYAFATRGVHA